MRKKHVVAILLVAVAMLATGCDLFGPKVGTVTGHVLIDGKAPGEMVVEVVVVGKNNRARVSEDGKFQLQLPAGSYELEARGLGLEATPVKVTVQGGKEVTVELQAAVVQTYPVTLDFSKPEHQALVEKPYPLEISFEVDEFGDTALVFPGLDGQQAPGLSWTRYVWLNMPNEMDTFSISLDQIGYPDMFQSLSVLFGAQDVNNFYHIYMTHTDTSHIGRVVDGVNTVLCREGAANKWTQDDEAYQSFELTVTRDGDDIVVGAVANGTPLVLDGCRIPAAEYEPGKIGIGGNSHVRHASAFKNIVIDQP